MIKATLLILLLMIAGCSSNEVEKPVITDECAYIVERILNIQRVREVARKDFSITVGFKKEDKVSDPVWESEYSRWIDRENMLATSAANLYEQARTHKCF